MFAQSRVSTVYALKINVQHKHKVHVYTFLVYLTLGFWTRIDCSNAKWLMPVLSIIVYIHNYVPLNRQYYYIIPVSDTYQESYIWYSVSVHMNFHLSTIYNDGLHVIAGVHERPHIYTLMQTHINPEMTEIRPIPLLLPHHHKSVPGEKRVGNQP